MKDLLEKSSYTGYFWVNQNYLKHIQYGIQAAHCVSDMSLLDNEIYRKWAVDHKTVLIFDGTNHGTLHRISAILDYAQRNLKKEGIDVPVANFHEDWESLGGILTAVGIILPNIVRSVPWGEYYVDGVEVPFIEPLYEGDSQKQPWEVTTQAYFERVKAKNELHDFFDKSRAAGERTWYRDYEHDAFCLWEFSDWMRRQRLAS